MEKIAALMVLAVLVEAVIEGAKGALGIWNWISLALGAVLCVLAGVDVFAMLDVGLRVPYVGPALTGVIAGRGASVVFDLWERAKGTRE